MKDAPAFDFYPERWTHGTRLMTKVERCDYIDLLCQQWTDDGLPAELDMIARLLGYRKPSQIPSILLEKFPISDDGKRRNPRLEIEREKQRERIEKRRIGAQITNAKRWQKESPSDRSATLERVANESPPPTTHPTPLVLLEKEPKGAGVLDLVPEIQSIIKNPIPESVRLALQPLYKRGLDTAWSAKEIATWRTLKLSETQALQDIALFAKARAAGWLYYRRDIQTLLNNWQAEIEKASDELKTAKKPAAKIDRCF